MDYFPSDLIPLPTMPYDARPDELPLDVEECRTAIWRSKGNITEAAKILKTSSLRLRRFVASSPRLTEEQREAQDILMDKSEAQIADALDDKDDKIRADNAAKFVLTNLGARRGYGTKGASITLKPGEGRGSFKVTWGDGEEFGPPPETGQVIDHEA